MFANISGTSYSTLDDPTAPKMQLGAHLLRVHALGDDFHMTSYQQRLAVDLPNI